MNIKISDTVASIVTSNLNSAFIFNFYGIDFYSRGQRTLEEACIEENVPIVSIVEELYDLRTERGPLPDFGQMKMKELSTYILRTHHKYTEKKLVYIKNTLNKLIAFYGEDYSNLLAVKNAFEHLSVYLTVHMKHEEFVVFPFINKIGKTPAMGSSSWRIDHPIAAMRDDHGHEVLTLRTLSKLTNNYTVPRNSDFTFEVTYRAMKDLEEDLKIHMHLENNILFPKAIQMAHGIHENLN